MNSNKTKPNPYLLSAILLLTLLVTIAFFMLHPRTRTEYKETPSFDDINISQYFPLEPGNRWVYQGVVKYTNHMGESLEQPVEVSMTVTGVVRNEDVSLYLMNGHPDDFAWTMPEKPTPERIKPPAQKYGYLVIANKVFRVREADLQAVSDGVSNGNYLPELDQAEPEFEFPLFKGQRFGDTAQLARSDHNHIWYVESKTPAEAKRDPSAGPLSVYELVFQTSPDTTDIKFQPYLGITAYSYRHHGTLMETDLELVDSRISP